MKLGFWSGWGKPISLRIGATGGGGDTTYTISGTVYDADGSTAVSGATVALGALNATSAANGTYTISNVPAGTSGSMTCTKAGYSWTAITVSAMTGNLANQNYTNAWWAALGLSSTIVAAYRCKGAASLAASYVNLANPGTNDAVPTVAPNFDTAFGWQGTGTQYLTLPSIADGYSVIICFNGWDTIGNKYLFGNDNNTLILFLNSSSALFRYGGVGNEATASWTPPLPAATFGLRKGSYAVNATITNFTAGGIAGTKAVAILSVHDGLTPCTANITAAVVLNVGWTDAQYNMIRAAMQAF